MKLCTGYLVVMDNHHKKTSSYRRHEAANRSNMYNAEWWAGAFVRPVGVKRMRLVCPKCKRKILASVRTCEDGCCLYQVLPPHKPKLWWKKRRH